MKITTLTALLFITFLFWNCSSIVTKTEFYKPIMLDLKNGDYLEGLKKLEVSELEGDYSDKDRVLLYLDKGIIFHYAEQYSKSNAAFEKAEFLIDSLYTKNISRGAASVLLNDNALAYSGEVYENLYINIFKALNYIHLNKFEDSYVEVHRITNKLKELNTYFKEDVAQLNKSEDSKIKFDAKDIEFYDDVFAEYISYLIYRASGDEDDSRISMQKANEAWVNHSDVYNYNPPNVLDSTIVSGTFLNIFAFAGTAPEKIPIGARITTFDNFITISDPSLYYVEPIPFSGIKSGWNFKFEFPSMKEAGTFSNNIEVYIDSTFAGNLQLLENTANVAFKTFESHKNATFFKTAMRAIAKGIGAGKLGESIKDNMDNKGLGDILAFVLNAAVDATEHADLRTWRTIPGYVFVGEFPIAPGNHNIEIRFLDSEGNLLASKTITNYLINNKLNIIESFYLN